MQIFHIPFADSRPKVGKVRLREDARPALHDPAGAQLSQENVPPAALAKLLQVAAAATQGTRKSVRVL